MALGWRSGLNQSHARNQSGQRSRLDRLDRWIFGRKIVQWSIARCLCAMGHQGTLLIGLLDIWILIGLLFCPHLTNDQSVPLSEGSFRHQSTMRPSWLGRWTATCDICFKLQETVWTRSLVDWPQDQETVTVVGGTDWIWSMDPDVP